MKNIIPYVCIVITIAFAYYGRVKAVEATKSRELGLAQLERAYETAMLAKAATERAEDREAAAERQKELVKELAVQIENCK